VLNVRMRLQIECFAADTTPQPHSRSSVAFKSGGMLFGGSPMVLR
jgi:hypothetical protein